MSIINCPECSKEISDKASSCPNCGYPISKADSTESKPNLKESNSDSVGCLLQFLSFLIPILGLILGCSYISANKSKQGKDLIYLALSGFAISMFVIIILRLTTSAYN